MKANVAKPYEKWELSQEDSLYCFYQEYSHASYAQGIKK